MKVDGSRGEDREDTRVLLTRIIRRVVRLELSFQAPRCSPGEHAVLGRVSSSKVRRRQGLVLDDGPASSDPAIRRVPCTTPRPANAFERGPAKRPLGPTIEARAYALQELPGSHVMVRRRSPSHGSGSNSLQGSCAYEGGGYVEVGAQDTRHAWEGEMNAQ